MHCVCLVWTLSEVVSIYCVWRLTEWRIDMMEVWLCMDGLRFGSPGAKCKVAVWRRTRRGNAGGRRRPCCRKPVQLLPAPLMLRMHDLSLFVLWGQHGAAAAHGLPHSRGHPHKYKVYILAQPHIVQRSRAH